MEPSEFKRKVAEVYKIAREIGSACKVDKCTPDGHLVSAFGQAAAISAFGLKAAAPKDDHNCSWSDGQRELKVQVRCTGRGSISMTREPDHLIALDISSDGKFTLIYNGPGKKVWGANSTSGSAIEGHLPAGPPGAISNGTRAGPVASGSGWGAMNFIGATAR